MKESIGRLNTMIGASKYRVATEVSESSRIFRTGGFTMTAFLSVPTRAGFIVTVIWKLAIFCPASAVMVTPAIKSLSWMEEELIEK